jgi:hypothetical protein
MPKRAWGRALEQPDQASLAAQLVEEEADPHPPFALSPTIRESSKMTLLGRPVLGLSMNPMLLSEENTFLTMMVVILRSKKMPASTVFQTLKLFKTKQLTPARFSNQMSPALVE